EEAERIRRRYHDESLAGLCEAHARELDAALRTSLEEKVTLAEAAGLCGYSKSHLRRLMDQGRIPNVGSVGQPRLCIGDLPYRPGRMSPERAVRIKTEKRPKRGVRRISVADLAGS